MKRDTRRVAARPRVASPARALSPARADAERTALQELERWRLRTVPDASAPLEADDLVRLVRSLIASLALDDAIVRDFTVNTVHYYRRKDVIDPPTGRTVSARYALRHLWQIAGARLAGHLGLVTLAEARAAMRDAGEDALVAFLAARIADARARALVRAPSAADEMEAPRPLPKRNAPLTMLSLPGGAMCLIPESHPARHSQHAAAELGRALASALRATQST